MLYHVYNVFFYDNILQKLIHHLFKTKNTQLLKLSIQINWSVSPFLKIYEYILKNKNRFFLF